MRRFHRFAIAALLALCSTRAVLAQPVPGSPSGAAEARDTRVEGWDELISRLRDLPTRMLARLPSEMQNDPQVRQEVARLALAALASSALDTLSADGDHPFFLPQLNMLLFAGQPNPDTVYRFTQVTPGGTYRLRGSRGNVRLAMIGEMPPYRVVNGVETPMPIRFYHDINALRVDAQGRFDVILSPERPQGYGGDWWPLDPTTDRLLLRMVSSNWPTERDPTVAIERVDAPASHPLPSATEMEFKLRALPRRVDSLAPMFVDKVEQLRREGYVNKLKVFDVSQMGGLAGQFYYEGPFVLADDEALIVETRAPKSCLYRSIMITDETYDTVDWYSNHSSLNDSQAQVDADGVLRIVVSSRDPGTPNWLDTAGHRRGLIQGRWMQCDAQPIPSVRKVPFSEVRHFLPAGTPTVSLVERERVIRERRAALQLRSLW